MKRPQSNTAEITKSISEHLEVVTVSRPEFKKFYINAHPNGDTDHLYLFQNLADFIKRQDARIVSQDVYGSCKSYHDGMDVLKKLFGEIQWPVTWIEGYGPGESNLTGTQIYAVSGTEIETIKLDGQIIGNTFEDKDAKYCFIGDLRARDTTTPRRKQAAETFQRMEDALKLVDMDFSNVIRTWVYINNILSWYEDFNTVRNRFYEERNLFQTFIPASTGIGVANPAGAALISELFAIKPKNHNALIRAVASPLQCSATDYKSSFSRAAEVKLSDHRRLYVSGTASIDSKGRTTHKANVQNQIEYTMKVVGALLESCEMSWADTSRAIAYFKDINNLPLLTKYCNQNSLPPLPIAAANGEICRQDLLFEIEVDAVTGNTK